MRTTLQPSVHATAHLPGATVLSAPKRRKPGRPPGRAARADSAPAPAPQADPGGDTALRLYLREIGPVPLLSRAEEVALAKRIQKGDEAAREQMIKANLRLVVKIASEFDGYGLPLLDLISEGNIGLMKAAERFDPGFGAKFSTYAMWWIKQAIRRALSNQTRLIRLPVHVNEKLLRLSRAANRLHEELGREPGDDELGAEVHLPEHKVRRLRTAALRPTSLDEPVGDDGAKTIAELVADEAAVQPENSDDCARALQALSEALSALDPREQRVLQARFGLDGCQARTLEDIGAEIGVTREYVRQIQNRALSRMRRQISALGVAGV
jgi:RNA polymerase primary sigma factor